MNIELIQANLIFRIFF